MDLLIPNKIYSVKTAALAFDVHESSIYQSMPGAKRPKLGRCLPEPVRFGRAVRWSGQQLIDFLSVPVGPAGAIEQSCVIAELMRPGRGRPRKVQLQGGAA